MRDGRLLADELEAARSKKTEGILSVVQPYVQVADSSATCKHTGLNLFDIWRYFRYTWVNPYQTVPGRSIALLVRDAAAPNHPVIGIAALGSAVVHQTARDELIGWQTDTFLERLRKSPTRRMAQWLLSTVQRFIDEVYIVDLLSDDTLRKVDLKKPDAALIAKLESEAALEKNRHFKRPESARVSNVDVGAMTDNDWEELSQVPLYRSKRCRLLASFLKMRMAFIEAGFTSATPTALKQALHWPVFKNAVRSLVSRVKSERVGIDMMDITVCGALPPYNHILGGKLVCMLLCSPEVRRIYEDRYRSAPSIIASALKGKRLVRRPTLACLSTTSLYGQNSSQYNRVKIPATAAGGKSGAVIEYRKGGADGGGGHHSQGYGTFHFRQSTLDALEEWITLEAKKDRSARSVNYIFGEGTSPKLRKLRDKISAVGLPGDEALRHARSRIVYFISLVENTGDFLLGLDTTPRWILPQKSAEDVTRQVAVYWSERWLAMRIESQEVIDKVREHTLDYPITHGARVPRLPESVESDLFDQLA
ncbi:MAG TPA: Druantia anti-phage system protein DruA [Verrucomicrobiales bacterium]|nr:Druantia anti-phage system protein DruA [Verrucomicrobiales bacterium]